MTTRERSLLLSGILLASGPALAKEQERTLESSRFNGRGNTYVAGYDSDEATRANPATLCEEKVKFQLRWLQLDLFIGENTLDTISEATDLANSAETSAVSLLQTFADKFGKRQYLRFQAVPLATRIFWFEMSPFTTTTIWADMRVPTTPDVQFYLNTMQGMNLSFGMPLTKDFDVGLTVRPMYRTLFTGDVQFADLLDFVESDDMTLDDVFAKREGLQVGADLGAIWKAGKDLRLGMTIENAGYAGTYGEFQDAPPPQPQRVNLGMNYRWDYKPWHWDWAVDLQDAVNPQQFNYLRLIHLGTEIGRSYISRDHDIGLLAGINEGYFTTGAFLDLWITRLTMSYYAVELGEYPGQRKDRRWALTLLSSMTF